LRPIAAADLLNDRVTDRGSEYCGNPERHEYKFYLAIEDMDRSRTKTKSPQTNGICERFPQDRAQRVLPCRLPQEGVSFNRRAYRPTSICGFANIMSKGRIKDAGALWQDTDANVP